MQLSQKIWQNRAISDILSLETRKTHHIATKTKTNKNKELILKDNTHYKVSKIYLASANIFITIQTQECRKTTKKIQKHQNKHNNQNQTQKHSFLPPKPHNYT